MHEFLKNLVFSKSEFTELSIEFRKLENLHKAKNLVGKVLKKMIQSYRCTIFF